MPVAGAVTIVIALAICLALAYYLIQVVRVLHDVNDSLGKITFGVRAIAHRTQPLGELLTPVKVDLEAVADTLESVAAELADTSAA